MHGELNLLNPYEIVGNDNEKYWFLTECGECYVAGFTNSPGYFCQYPQFNNNLLSFAFEPCYNHRELPGLAKGTPKIGEFQKRIMDTVIWILLESFRKSPEKPIVIICESEDGLAACRHRLFDRWFRKADKLLTHSISKYDSNFNGEGYGSIFIHHHDPHYELIRNAFINTSCSDK